MGNFLLGLLVGVVGCIITAVLVYRKEKEKINQALLILDDKSLTIKQKIAKIKELFGIRI